MQPENLTAIENGLGSLSISWELDGTILGVMVDFVVIIRLEGSSTERIFTTKLNQVVMSADNTSCDMYSIQIVANNSAGQSPPSERVTAVFPSLPDISSMENSLEYSLHKTSDNEVTLTVTSRVRLPHWKFLPLM